MNWTAQDEINLHKWIEAKGFKIVYLPEVEQYGYTHDSGPQEINAGFNRLADLKQFFVNLKGDHKNVRIVSEGDFFTEMEKARKLQMPR